MAMKKAEMEAHRDEYHARISEAHEAEQKEFYHAAVDHAMSSLHHVDGMMRYERRYEYREFDTLDGIEIILEYAPLLFLFHSLDAVESLLNDNRQIERNTLDPLSDKLAEARERMFASRRIWNHLEHHPGAQEEDLPVEPLDGDGWGRWWSSIDAWEEMGIVRQTETDDSQCLSFVTQMDEAARAKCPGCGIIAKGPKFKFLATVACPKCKSGKLFVILSESPNVSRGK